MGADRCRKEGTAMKELKAGEVYGLEECLKELAEHHNEVSVHFRGCYPKRPFREIMESFEKDIREGKSRIGAVTDGERILGFCKADISGTEGKVDYLIVLKEARRKGYGDLLLDWAMDVFRQAGVSRIEVRVVDGNDAAGFYEKHGFRVCSHVMRTDL